MYRTVSLQRSTLGTVRHGCVPSYPASGSGRQSPGIPAVARPVYRRWTVQSLCCTVPTVQHGCQRDYCPYKVYQFAHYSTYSAVQ